MCLVPGQASAQDTNQNKTDKPLILYSGTPQKYEIGGIRVTGGEGYEDYVLIGLSGLSVGQTITVPGDEVTLAAIRGPDAAAELRRKARRRRSNRADGGDGAAAGEAAEGRTFSEAEAADRPRRKSPQRARRAAPR